MGGLLGGGASNSMAIPLMLPLPPPARSPSLPSPLFSVFFVLPFFYRGALKRLLNANNSRPAEEYCFLRLRQGKIMIVDRGEERVSAGLPSRIASVKHFPRRGKLSSVEQLSSKGIVLDAFVRSWDSSSNLMWNVFLSLSLFFSFFLP